MIDFAAMNVGDEVELTGSKWEIPGDPNSPDVIFGQAQEFTETHPEYQFQAVTRWRFNETTGFDERYFVLIRTR